MIVVAIIGILAAIAIPAYQDYTIRAKVTEMINQADAAKTSVSEYYTSQGHMPLNPTSAGINTAASTQYMASITYTKNDDDNGTIEVKAAADIGGTAGGTTMQFKGTGGTSGVQWTCAGLGTMPSKYKPANCR